MAQSRLQDLWRWFGHPVVGFVGTLLGVVGLVLTVVYYFKALPSRQIILLEPSVRAVFVSKNAPAALDLQLNGKPVLNQSVFAAQLVMWNAGNVPIRPEHVLTPVTISVPSGSQIVDARVLRKTREVCNIAPMVAADGTSAQIDWRIIEPGDGAIIQLTLLGDIEGTLKGKGAVESGGEVTYSRVKRTSSDPVTSELWPGRGSFLNWTGAVALAAGFSIAGVGLLIRAGYLLRVREKGWQVLSAIALVLGVFFSLGGFGACRLIWQVMFLRDHIPTALF